MIDTNSAEVEFERNGHDDRRGKRRFRIDQEVRYRLLYGQRLAETGVGRTLNMSSSGVSITTQTVLTAGLPVELSISWPALLNDVCPMKLMIYGCVVRSTEKMTAVNIERYEFRTQGSRALQSASSALEDARMAAV
jgi:hypothetical protein